MDFGIVQPDGSIVSYPMTIGHIIMLVEPNADYGVVCLQQLGSMLNGDGAPGMEATLLSLLMPSVVRHEPCNCGAGGRQHWRTCI